MQYVSGLAVPSNSHFSPSIITGILQFPTMTSFVNTQSPTLSARSVRLPQPYDTILDHEKNGTDLPEQVMINPSVWTKENASEFGK